VQGKLYRILDNKQVVMSVHELAVYSKMHIRYNCAISRKLKYKPLVLEVPDITPFTVVNVTYIDHNFSITLILTLLQIYGKYLHKSVCKCVGMIVTQKAN